MKLNITKDKLTRVLLSANPILANCKGSKKAVRIFLNMLGMKNIVTSQTLRTVFTLTGLTNVENDTTYLNYLKSEIFGIVHNCFGTYIKDINQNTDCLKATSPTNGNVSILDVDVNYVSSTSVEISFRPYDYMEIVQWNMYYPNEQINTNVSINEMNKILVKANNEFVKFFNERNKSQWTHLGNAKLAKNAVSVSQYSTDNDEFSVLITNVTDKEMLAAKSTLANQLQEILPINMIVEADNIIGCANE